MVTAETYNECDACGHQAGGYSKKDLLAQGWKWHDAGAERMFVICGDCEDLYAKRRTAKAAV